MIYPRENAAGAPRDPDERALVERIESGVEDLARPGDAGNLLDATGWVEHVDDLVRAAERAPEITAAPSAEDVRDAVLARLAPRAPTHARTGRRRRSSPRLPWWQAAAPFVVAAGLAGLFLWHYREGEPVPRPAPSNEVTQTQEFAPMTSDETRESFVAPGAANEFEKSAAEPRVLSSSPELDVAPMARMVAPMAELALPSSADAAAESLLAILRREPDSLAVADVRVRWNALRPALTDTTLSNTVERALRCAESGGVPR